MPGQSEPPAPCMQSFEVSQEFKNRMDLAGYEWKSGNGECIGDYLTDDLFFFREDFHETDESIFLERNIIDFMPRIVTSRNPLLRAAKINIQHEFARAVESIRRGREYDGKNLLYIAGLNIDISEQDHPLHIPHDASPKGTGKPRAEMSQTHMQGQVS